MLKAKRKELELKLQLKELAQILLMVIMNPVKTLIPQHQVTHLLCLAHQMETIAQLLKYQSQSITIVITMETAQLKPQVLQHHHRQQHLSHHHQLFLFHPLLHLHPLHQQCQYLNHQIILMDLINHNQQV